MKRIPTLQAVEYGPFHFFTDQFYDL